MTDVTVTINRRAYQVACENGQEEHLRGLGRQVAKRVDDLVGSMGQIGDQRLLVMASLLIADDAEGARQKLAEAQKKVDAMSAREAAENESAGAIEDLAARIEELAGAMAKD